jgi:hypothetical protein
VSIGIDDWKLRRVCQPTTAASSAPARHRKPHRGRRRGAGPGLLGLLSIPKSRPKRSVAYPEAPRRVSAEYRQHADGTHASEVIHRGSPRRIWRTYQRRRQPEPSHPVQPSSSLTTLRRVGQRHAYPPTLELFSHKPKVQDRKNLKTEKTFRILFLLSTDLRRRV